MDDKLYNQASLSEFETKKESEHHFLDGIAPTSGSLLTIMLKHQIYQDIHDYGGFWHAT